MPALISVLKISMAGAIGPKCRNIADMKITRQLLFSMCFPSYLCFFLEIKRLKLPSLELCRLYCDLLWCYKIMFGHVDINFDDMFELGVSTNTRGHKYKLFIIVYYARRQQNIT